MERWVDGTDGFLDLEPERSKVGGLREGIDRQRAYLSQNGLSLLRGEVCRQQINIADGRGVALWSLRSHRDHLSAGPLLYCS